MAFFLWRKALFFDILYYILWQTTWFHVLHFFCISIMLMAHYTSEVLYARSNDRGIRRWTGSGSCGKSLLKHPRALDVETPFPFQMGVTAASSQAKTISRDCERLTLSQTRRQRSESPLPHPLFPSPLSLRRPPGCFRDHSIKTPWEGENAHGSQCLLYSRSTSSLFVALCLNNKLHTHNCMCNCNI